MTIATPAQPSAQFESFDPEIPTLQQQRADAAEHCHAAFVQCRQRVLHYLVKLNKALDAGVWDLADCLLLKFCHALTRYLSLSHGRTFQAVDPDSPATQPRRSWFDPHQYIAIAATSRDIMRFTDQFGNPEQREPALVRVELERLALLLETRFELEDDLLARR